MNKAEEIIRKYKTRNPFKIIEASGIILRSNYEFKNLKGMYFVVNKSRFITINGNLHPRESIVTAAHELGHDVFHRRIASAIPMKDISIYDMSSKTEYEANIFAADLLIDDDELARLASDKNEDYFSICAKLAFSPDLVSFKLFSMTQRGYNYNLPKPLDSSFLK